VTQADPAQTGADHADAAPRIAGPLTGVPLPASPLTAVPLTGLSAREVQSRTDAGYTNKSSTRPSRTLWHIFRANVLTLFNGIIAACFLIMLLLNEWKDALFGFSATANAIIGIAQEYRAKRALDRLAVLTAPRARVLRDGAVTEIPFAAVVRDDVLLLRAGDQVVADAVVLSAEGLELDESLLTGESKPVDKAADAEILSGSSVVAGTGVARAVRVGDDSFASRLTAEARRFSLVNSEIRSSLNRLLRWIAWALLPIMAVVANGQIQAAGGWDPAFARGTWREALVGAVASVTAMIPLGLVLMTSLAFAVGAVRLSRNMVLIQELPAVEVLARVDMLCIDKTGTLTEGGMSFDALHPVGSVFPDGLELALGRFAATGGNATAGCLTVVFADDGRLRPLVLVPFSSARKWSALSLGRASPAPGTWVLGAPELVLDAGAPGNGEALEQAAALAASGLRTLVLAHRSPALTPQEAEQDGPPRAVTAAALLTFRETIRRDAAETLAYFRRQGVQVKVFSGDDPRTVEFVAREVGLAADGYDARTLPADADALARVLAEHPVFGRVTPAQKQAMVKALQDQGHVVAMTGDGVNDTLALKAADIGIAMNTAAAATKAVSRLVLLDGSFSRLPEIVAEGRRVIANTETVATIFLTKTAYAVALSVVFGALLWGFPFLPRQMSITDALTIGIPAFFLALMPNAGRYVPGFLRRSLAFAVPAGLVVATAVLAVNVVAALTGAAPDVTRTGSVLALSVIALWVLAVRSRPLNGWRLLVIAAMVTGLAVLLTLPAATGFFELPGMPSDLLAVSLGVGAAGSAAIEVLGRWHRHRYNRQP